MSQAIFNDFLKQVAEVFQLKRLEPDSFGVCLIEIKKTHVKLMFEYDEFIVPNTVLLSSPILTFSPHDRHDICVACLKGNAAMDETLSIKIGTDTVYLHQRIHPNVKNNELNLILQSFQKQVQHWKKTLAAIGETTPQSEDSFHLFPYKA